MSARWIFLALSASLLVLLGAAAAGVPAYDHDAHKAANEAAGLSCTACHDLGPGGSGPSGMAATMKVEREALCHGCHVQGAALPLEGKLVKGPQGCETCHSSLPKPASHLADYASTHGADARLDAASCKSCHRQRDCVDCHERKQATGFGVHERSWPWIHGIAARTDPAGCDGCHLQADCVQCHTTGRPGSP